MNDNIPDLKFERIEDGIGEGLILLTQDDNGDPGRVAIHPLHLRYLAETFGIVKANDAETYRRVATMTRRLRLLADRVQHLNGWLHEHSDTRRADFTYEQTYSQATADLATEFCHGLDERISTFDGIAEQGNVSASEQGTLL